MGGKGHFAEVSPQFRNHRPIGLQTDVRRSQAMQFALYESRTVRRSQSSKSDTGCV